MGHSWFVGQNHMKHEVVLWELHLPTIGKGSRMRVAAETMAIVLSPDLMLWQAWWRAIILPEEPVSRAIDGPLRSKKYEIRLAMRALPVPMVWYLEISSGSLEVMYD